jgi:hypothetical protein
VLLLLVSNAGQTLTKQTIIETVWDDVFVNENSLAKAVAELVTHGVNGKIRSKDSFGNESGVPDTEH